MDLLVTIIGVEIDQQTVTDLTDEENTFMYESSVRLPVEVCRCGWDFLLMLGGWGI